MAPSWLPLCKSMQRYCEPFFAAIDNWIKYEDRNILLNRLQLIETACEMFKVHCEKRSTYSFELVCTNNDAPLLPEVLPSAGVHFVIGGDVQAFNAIKSRYPEYFFTKTGMYFQSYLLKGLAGWNAATLAVSNQESRKSLTACVEKLLRLPYSAGEGYFTVTELPDPAECTNVVTIPEPQIHTPPILSEAGRHIYNFLIEYETELKKEQKNKRFLETKQLGVMKTTPYTTTSNKKAKHSHTKKEQQFQEAEDTTGWKKHHSSVGTEVAAYFPPVAEKGVNRKLFVGTVVKYLPPTDKDKDDQLYHVLWEDGDEQDYDEKDLQKGIEEFDRMNGWIYDHESVGTKVAAQFPVKGHKGRTEMKTYQGIVKKYAPPTDSDPPLYHIVWEDGDEQDFDDDDLLKAVQLFKDHKESNDNGKNNSNINSSNNRRKSVTPSQNIAITSSSDETSNTSPMKMEVYSESSNSNNKRSRTQNPLYDNSYETSPPKSAKRDKKVTTQAKVDESEELEDEPQWIPNHRSIGTKVAAYFPCSVNDPDGVVVPSTKGKKTQKMKAFKGIVTKYAGPSAEGETDQLYHIEWEDGDEEDYFQHELNDAKELYWNLFGYLLGETH